MSAATTSNTPAPERASSPPTDPGTLADRLLLQADRARRSGDGTEYRRLVDEVVLLTVPLARSLAARYRNRGVDIDDLTQAAYLALVKAARGFDPQTGTSFLAYAVPTIRGEIRRYFRDCGWTVRPTRRIQELQARINAANETLVQRLGRSPRPSEVAVHVGASLEDVTEALAVDGCFTPSSLDRPVTQEHGSSTLGDLLGGVDPAAGGAEARVMLGPAVRALEDRDRLVLRRRFFDGWTQQEIGDEIGVTQMQVSRILQRILGTLRTAVGDEVYLG